MEAMNTHHSKKKLGFKAGLAGAGLALMLLAGCATPPPAGDREAVAEFDKTNDSIEPFNRAIFAFNRLIDTWFLRPAATFYHDLLPPVIQSGIHNFLANLRTPVVLLNDLLQGEGQRAGDTVARFVINTTIGIGGLGDFATDMGFKPHGEDFGQTLAVWGTPEGPYIMLPVLGPSNPRDIVGIVADFFTDPLNWWARNTDREWITWTRTGATAVDKRSEVLEALNEAEKSSLDYYATIRSLYRQRRADEITNGSGSSNTPVPGISGPMPVPNRAEVGGDVSQVR